LDAGILTGNKYTTIGMQTGQQFKSNPKIGNSG